MSFPSKNSFPSYFPVNLEQKSRRINLILKKLNLYRIHSNQLFCLKMSFQQFSVSNKNLCKTPFAYFYHYHYQSMSRPENLMFSLCPEAQSEVLHQTNISSACLKRSCNKQFSRVETVCSVSVHMAALKHHTVIREQHLFRE